MKNRKCSLKRNAQGKAHLVSRGLGAVSIAIGLMELLGTKKVSSELGMKKQRGVVKGYGLREVVNGVGLLSARNPAPWLWARVAGDGLDLATLASRSYNTGSSGRRRLILMVIAGVAAVTALDLMAAQKTSKKREVKESLLADYKKRSGFPRPAYQMRGIASDLMIPGDMRTPAALSPDLFEARNSTVQ